MRRETAADVAVLMTGKAERRMPSRDSGSRRKDVRPTGCRGSPSKRVPSVERENVTARVAERRYKEDFFGEWLPVCR